MKSAPKGIEMKLIQIFALATAMATMATAQNSGANSQTNATPSPTPVTAGKTGGAAQPATKKKATSGQRSGTKKSAGTPAAAKTSASKSGANAKGGTASAPASKTTAVKTTTAPVKGQSPTASPAKRAPTPVVAAKTSDTKKTEAKKVDAKKATAAKAPVVIGVKPLQTNKKAGTQTKATAKPPAKAPPAQVTSVGPSTKPAEKPRPAARTFGAHGRRDPFVSPIVSDKGGVNRPPSNCTSGKRCLVIPELVLQGTVKDTSGKMMAVVANSVRKTYFLRENDQVFQGSVEKITSDSIIFREYVKDALGRETAREVVKKLAPPIT
jgi:Tfp pilus assembly protein PilP